MKRSGNIALAALALCCIAATVEATQIRVQFSRVRADMRNMATAIESHFIDHLAYPPPTVTTDSHLENHWLTTPVAYLSSPLVDRQKISIEHWAPNAFAAVALKWARLIPIVVLALIAAAVYDLRLRDPERWTPLALFVWFLLIPITAYFISIASYCWLFRYPDNSPFGPERYFVPNRQWQGDHFDFNYHLIDVTDQRQPIWITQGVGYDGVLDFDSFDELTERPVSIETIANALVPFTYDATNGLRSRGDLFYPDRHWW